MVKVKSETEIQANYIASAGLVPARFEAGVKGADWRGPAETGQDLYLQKMAMPDILARRLSGVRKVDNASWVNDTITKGRGIIGARMTQAAPKQVAGYRPYKAALEALTLPPKTADPLSNVTNRVGAVVKAMVDTKAAQSR